MHRSKMYLYSITSSARSRNDSGMVRPGALKRGLNGAAGLLNKIAPAAIISTPLFDRIMPPAVRIGSGQARVDKSDRVEQPPFKGRVF
jgi:hypothetical protein